MHLSSTKLTLMIFDLSSQIVRRFTIAFTIVLLGMTNAFSQSSIENPNKLMDFLGQEKFNELINSNPSYISFLDVKCSSLFAITELSSEKSQVYLTLNEIEKYIWEPNTKVGEGVHRKIAVIISPSQFLIELTSPDFNILEYSFKQDSQENKYYVLGNTGKVILIRPVSFITKVANSRL